MSLSSLCITSLTLSINWLLSCKTTIQTIFSAFVWLNKCIIKWINIASIQPSGRGRQNLLKTAHQVHKIDCFFSSALIKCWSSCHKTVLRFDRQFLVGQQKLALTGCLFFFYFDWISHTWFQLVWKRWWKKVAEAAMKWEIRVKIWTLLKSTAEKNRQQQQQHQQQRTAQTYTNERCVHRTMIECIKKHNLNMLVNTSVWCDYRFNTDTHHRERTMQIQI